MERHTLNEAFEDLAMIKGVIQRTKRSFVSFSKIFIYWGMLFAFNSVITYLLMKNRNIMAELIPKYPVFNYLFPTAVVGVLAALIYQLISKQTPLVALEKRLMKVWLLVLAMNVIPVKINVQSISPAVELNEITVHVSNFSVMLFSLAIALIATALFTGFKHLKHIAYIYIGLTLLYSYFNIPLFTDVVVQSMYLVTLPFTFLYTGFYLKAQQPGRA